MTAPDLTEQPVPERAACPECGADATDASVRRHKLSALGYVHDDQYLECAECNHEWILGVPIGEAADYPDQLHCDGCDTFRLVHRVALAENQLDKTPPDRFDLHLKCPECASFVVHKRKVDTDPDQPVVLVGYPQLTGAQDGAEPFGYD